jgi:hypothetical protein
VNRIDQETVKRRGPTRAVEPLKKKKKKKIKYKIIELYCGSVLSMHSAMT